MKTLQRAIDDVEIEEKLPNEPKTTTVAKAGLKRRENTSSDTNDKSTQVSLKALEMLRTGVSIRKVCPCSNRHTSRRLQCRARRTHQGA
jgi:hypothetical protein